MKYEVGDTIEITEKHMITDEPIKYIGKVKEANKPFYGVQFGDKYKTVYVSDGQEPIILYGSGKKRYDENVRSINIGNQVQSTHSLFKELRYPKNDTTDYCIGGGPDPWDDC